MTERDPFGAALSAGEPGDRHSAAVNGEAGHELENAQDVSDAQDVEDTEGIEAPGEFADFGEATYYADLEEYYEPGDAGYAEEREGAGEGEDGAPLWYGEDAEGYYA